MEKTAKLIAELRQELGSITVEEIDELMKPQLTDSEQDARAGDAEIFYIKYFKKVLDVMSMQQYYAIGDKATDAEKMDFSRGTLNGFKIVEEWFKKQVNLSRARLNPNEGFEEE